jgi:hypothetical protein
MIQASVDRLEGDWIILVPESGPVFQIPCSLFPGLNEGDVIRINIEKDEPGKMETEKRIEDLRKGLNKSTL